jgi:phosphopantothenoylcysteine decarboxylase/phosphopantothenate--cysteine ligase
MLNGKNVLLGVTASIAAYKAANLVRLLKKSGANIQVIQTHKSLEFITPLTLSTLSENPVFTKMVNDEDNTWNNHVKLGLWADIMIIAPASAKTLSKMVNGDCDNLLIATYLSSKCPVYFAPAMDLDMFKHNSTKENIKKLEENLNILIPPTSGELASGLLGVGRMEEPENIISFINNHLSLNLPLSSKKVLITAGPTQEKIDDVRYISNYSSGKMGISLARVAAELGANVKLIIGPTNQNINHPNIEIINVISADQMYDNVLENFSSTDITICSAAVSDFKPKNPVNKKIKKETGFNNIELIPNKDILLEISKIKSLSQTLVGFALESDNERNNAISKLTTKNLDLVVLNSLNDKDAGFGIDTNKITLIDSDRNIEEFDSKSKYDVAKDIFNKILKIKK